jgi:hypothetical protein
LGLEFLFALVLIYLIASFSRKQDIDTTAVACGYIRYMHTTKRPIYGYIVIAKKLTVAALVNKLSGV